MAAIPVDLKAVAPYIKRAEELDKDTSHAESPVVAYYCRQYAMELGIELRENAKDAAAVGQFLLALIEDLEAAKEKLNVSREEGEQIVYKFAIDVFDRADGEDRSGKASKATARTFYAASVFMDTLKQFGDRGDEVDEKCRYAKWKAADILKARKEGREPTPGGPNQPVREDDIPEPPVSLPKIVEPTSPPPQSSSPPPSADFAEEPPSVTPSVAPSVAPSVTQQTPPAVTQTPPSFPPPQYAAPTAPPVVVAPRTFVPPPTTNQNHASRNNHRVSDDQIEDALEFSKFAIAALEIKDTNLAIERLQGALAVLQSS